MGASSSEARLKLDDPREHARLLAARGRKVAAQWRRVRRAVGAETGGWWSPAARALLAEGPGATVEAPLVALADELDDLIALQRRCDDLAGGDEEALEELVSALTEGEYVLELMPRGRLPRGRPRDLAPAIRRVLGSIQDDLLARLVIQWTIDGGGRPARAGTLALRPRFSPSWGHTSHSLLLGRGRALLVGEAPLPAAWTMTWDARGYELSSTASAPSVAIAGRWDRTAEWSIRAPGREVQLIPRAGPWPLLPPVIDEDGARAKALYPRPGSRRFRQALLGRAGEQAERIERALAVLAAAWPAGARTVEDFTRAIIPVTQAELVSYSFAPVPGWSYLNLYDRDFVDLIDDLVHENAHHHLNHILAGTPLLVGGRGDDENLVYYSPWRETLRPLRGILHSVFTFAAGAELFRRLFMALARGAPLPHRFSAAERRKIAARALEETMQVRYSLVDLAHAHRCGRLDASGDAMVREFRGALAPFKRLAPSLWAAIRGTPAERRLARLARTLKERRALTRRVGAARSL